MIIPRRKVPPPYLPFISLADIAWQIIIFFLVACTFVKNWSFTFALPSSSPTADTTIRRPIAVEASEENLTVNGSTIPLPDLELRLSGLLAGAITDEQRAVAVYFADDVTFQRNAEILYAIQKSGGVIVISQEVRHANRSKTQ